MYNRHEDADRSALTVMNSRTMKNPIGVIHDSDIPLCPKLGQKFGGIAFSGFIIISDHREPQLCL